MSVNYRIYEFLDELLRLAEQYDSAIIEVVDAMTKSHVPQDDYENKLQNLLRTLAAKGRKDEVWLILDRLPAMHHLYNELTRS